MLTALAFAALAAQPAKNEPLKVSFPHPVITEVLYAVPTGESGDANKDGVRNAAGDEFVELINPHDKPIQLKGYRITDKSLGKAGALSFTFPECEIKPGGVIVVFNGFEANISAPCGDSAKAPGGPNDKFGGAMVFSMKVTSNRIGFSNTADCVVITAPDGKAIEIVRWGAISETLPECPLVAEAPTTNKASVARKGLVKAFVVHDSFGGGCCSPGKFDKSAAAAPPAPSEEKKTDPPADKAKPDAKKPADTKPKPAKP